METTTGPARMLSMEPMRSTTPSLQSSGPDPAPITGTARRALPPRVRKAVLTVHIVVSVGLLGDAAGFLAVAIRAATTADAEFADACYRVLQMFSIVFGIPLSVATLVTGIVLGVGTKWGVFRYPWVTAKLALIVSVMAVGALVLGPSVQGMLDGTADAEAAIVAAAAYDVSALCLATALSVFKPGRRMSRPRT